MSDLLFFQPFFGQCHIKVQAWYALCHLQDNKTSKEGYFKQQQWPYKLFLRENDRGKTYEKKFALRDDGLDKVSEKAINKNIADDSRILPDAQNKTIRVY